MEVKEVPNKHNPFKQNGHTRVIRRATQLITKVVTRYLHISQVDHTSQTYLIVVAYY